MATRYVRDLNHSLLTIPSDMLVSGKKDIREVLNFLEPRKSDSLDHPFARA
jgi:hypothetical protein